jgi:hypothetical protein
MRRVVFHGLGIAGASLATFAIWQWVGGDATLALAAAETVTGVGAMWFALALLS